MDGRVTLGDLFTRTVKVSILRPSDLKANRCVLPLRVVVENLPYLCRLARDSGSAR